MAFGSNKLSRWQTLLQYIALAYSFLFPLEVFDKLDDRRNRTLEIFYYYFQENWRYVTTEL